MVDGASLLALSLLGGVLTLEGTSVGQFMLSRPLVAGTLTGWLLGVPGEGMAVGALLEVYLLVAFPVGGARFPESASATIAAVAAAAPGTPAAMALGLAAGLVVGQVAGLSTTLQRTFNARLVSPDSRPPDGARVVRAHLGALAVDFLRGCFLTGAGVVFARSAVASLGPAWPLAGPHTRGLLLLGALVSVGVLLRSFGGLRRRAGVVGAGLAAGLGMGWLL